MSAQAVRLTESDIDDALASDELEVVFQPVFSFEDGAPLRVEAFVRWSHPTLGTLPPGAFISFFESQGRMGDLTRHVVRRALRAYKSWRGTQGPGLSVNLAASDIADESFPDALTGILAAERMPPSLLMLECPPVTAQGAEDVWDRYRHLSSTGCPLAVEVRGRASEALWSADPFPFAEIKTGGPAVLRFARTARGGPGLTAISELIELARKRGARCVAVGIEDASSAAALKTLGFDGGQGNLLSAAGPLEGVSAQAINKVREGLGLAPLDQDDLRAVFQRKSDRPPLLLEDEAKSAPLIDPGADESMARAIALLKAKKIAAKKLALAKAEDERRETDAEIAAARQASDTAKRLQERLEAELGVPAEEAGAARSPGVAGDAGTAAPRDPSARPSSPEDRPAAEAASPAEEGPAEKAPAPEDDEAGLLLSDDLAEVALGVVRRRSFADGLSTDGYRSGRGASQGAMSDDALPSKEEEAEVADAICRILDALPGDPESGAETSDAARPVSRLAEAARRAQAKAKAKAEASAEARRYTQNQARIRGQAAKALPAPPAPQAEPLSPRAEAPAPQADAEVHSMSVQPGTFALDVALEEDLSPEDLLDRAVAAVPEIDEDAGDLAFSATEGTEAALAARIRRPRRRRTNLLTRKYRITHFWPRSWVRAARRYKTAQSR